MIITDKNKILNFFLEITGNNKNDIEYIKNLIQVYPNVIDLMLSDITPDLSEVKYVKLKRYNALKNKVIQNANILDLNNQLYDAFPIHILKQIRNYFKEETYFNNNYFYNTPVFLSDKEINSYIVSKIKSKPYEFLCNIYGFNFNKVDKLLLDANELTTELWANELKNSLERCISFIQWYLSNCMNGNTIISLETLKIQMLKKFNLIDCIDKFNEAISYKKFTLINNGIMLTSTYLEEKYISDFVKKCKYIKQSYNINVSNYEYLDNFKLTSDQLKTLELLNDNQLVLLNGFAGTGKSSSVKSLINMLEDNNKTYIIMAPTAKAAKTISAYTEKVANTIHYVLCSHFNAFNTHYFEESYSNDSQEDILDYDVIIIDETSMISVNLFSSLLRFIDPNRSKVLLIGDSYQLPSIQSGNLYQDLLNISDIPKVTLEKIFRYEENGLVTVATNMRYGKKYLNQGVKIQSIGESYTFYNCDDIMEMINTALNKYMDLLKDNNIEDIAILTAKNIGNSGTNLINNCIQKIINPINEFDDYISIMIDGQKIKFKENDLVMNTKNMYGIIAEGSESQTLIANGQIGKIKSVNIFDNSLRVKIDDEIYNFTQEDIKNLRLAYCFTIHKSQGSQFKHIIYLTSSEDMFMTNSNLMYVAVTRAQESCHHFGSRYVINYKINEKENLKRNTTLLYQYNN